MFKIQDIVMHNQLGICRIIDILSMEVSGKKGKYYRLQSLYESGNKAYVPVKSAEEIIRYPMDNAAATDLIKRFPKLSANWIEESRNRKESYAQIISEGNPEALVGIIRTLYEKDQEKRQSGKRISEVDIAQQKRAEKILHQELAYALNIEPDAVKDTIKATLNKN